MTLARDARLILAAKTVRTFGYGLLGVLLGLYLDQSGYDPTQVGLILSTALIGSALLTSFFAVRADALGRRRTLMLSTLLLIVSGLAFALAQNVWLLIFAALTGTISATASEVGPFETVEQAMLPQTVPAAQRNRIFGTYSTLAALAVAGGSLAAGITEPLGGALRLEALGAYRLMFGVVAALGGLTFALFALLSEQVEVGGARAGSAVELPRQQSSPTSNLSPATPQETLTSQERGVFALPSRSLRTGERASHGLQHSRPLIIRLAALFALDAFGGGFVLQSIIAYWFGKQFNAGPEIVGPVFFGANIMKAISFPIAVRLADRFGLINTMVFSHLPSNVLLMAIPFMPTLPLAIALLLARHLLSQMDVPTRAAYLAAIVAPSERTAANGVINVTRTITQALSPSIAGFAISLANLAAPFLLGGAIKIVYDLLLYAQFRKVKPSDDMHTG